MQKLFFKSAALFVVLNLLVKPLWIFGIDLPTQNAVGAEAYGLYYSLLNFSLIFNILLDLGTNHASSRKVAMDAQKLARSFTIFFSLRLLLAFVYALLCIVFAWVLHYSWEAVSLLILLLINQILASFLLFFRANIAALQKFFLDSLLSILDRAGVLLIAGFLLYSSFSPFEYNIQTFIYAQMAAYSLAACIAFVLCYRQLPFFRWVFKMAYYREALRESLPFALLILLMGLYTRVDAIMLERIQGSEAAGHYAAGFRLLDLSNQLGYIFAVLLLPMFAKLMRDYSESYILALAAFKTLWFVSIPVALWSFFNGEWLISFLYSQPHPAMVQSFWGLMLAFPAFCITYVYGTLLTAHARMKWLNLLALFGFLFNIIFNAYWIPKYGVQGAVIATLITQWGTAIIQAFLAKKILNKSVGFLPLIQWALYPLLLIAFWLMPFWNDISLIIKSLMWVLFCIALAYPLQLLPLNQLFKLIKQKTEG